MIRTGEYLHRATPVPSETFSSRRPSGNLSVSSIAEEETEEHDSATSLSSVVERLPANKGKISRLSPVLSGKVANKTKDETGSVRPLSGLRSLTRRLSGSGPPSPTVSDDSEGSGTTFRSAESLHRPTPIPQDASSSYKMAGSFSRRSSGRAQPTTPTIQEFEDFEDYSKTPPNATGHTLAKRESLHRATPIPGDLLSSSSSLGRSQTHRPITPTIREDAPNEQEAGLDDHEHFYGAPVIPDEGGSVYTTPRTDPIDLANFAPHSSGVQPDNAGRSSGHGDVNSVGASLKPDSGVHGGLQALPIQSASNVSPFVESKDWDRDILGVARFLRMCPGLSRQIIGDLLGENNERCLRVLECFTATFDFTGIPFEAALREYLESFRLPGEAQKIYRILEAWSRQFFAQCPGIFKTADAVHVLAFSAVLLNTDLHNNTVKRKMTCEEFVCNNKGVNAKEDFPKAMLEDLFKNIERRAIRIPAAHPLDALGRHNSLPEPIKATHQRYIPAKQNSKGGCFCFS